jgi:hypothetical protein
MESTTSSSFVTAEAGSSAEVTPKASLSGILVIDQKILSYLNKTDLSTCSTLNKECMELSMDAVFDLVAREAIATIDMGKRLINPSF